MRKNVAILSDYEISLFEKGKEDPNALSDYWFRKANVEHGWIFDQNFDPEGAWQKMVHEATQSRIIVVGGFGSGKTRGIAISACVWALLVPDFAFLNAAPKAWQSELMYKFILQISRGTPFERLIYSAPKRPYPSIELRFIVNGVTIISTMEFMSVEKNANTILGWEGDWANIDEAGQLDNLSEVITSLGTRLRGSINGRDRLGRLSMITNSWENPELWYRYDLATSDPTEYLSLTVSSRHNHNITQRQLAMFLKDIPEDEHDRFIDGSRPEGLGNYFSKYKIYEAEDKDYGDTIVSAVKNNTPGYYVRGIHGAGVVHFEVPARSNNMYMILGDPGVEAAPNRNSPAIMVWDITNFPKEKAIMVAAWWGNGNGVITPFITRLLMFMEKYNSVFTAVDATGTQKNTNTLLNLYLAGTRADSDTIQSWVNVDVTKIMNLKIAPMDFSGSKKSAYLISGRLFIESGLVVWPKFFLGLRAQLTNYDPDKDRSDVTSKISQDLVACFCMSAYAIRAWFSIDPNLIRAQDPDPHFEVVEELDPREFRYSREARSTRMPTR